MVDEGLTIKISGDTSGIQQAFSDVKKQTAGLQGDLNQTAEAAKGVFASFAFEKIGEYSKEAFGILREQLTGALEAFHESEVSSLRLSNALQNQGIFSTQLKEAYIGYAEEIQKTTGLEADQIVSAQAVAQKFLGQIPITKDLTKAIADLAATQGGDLVSAATDVAKAIGNGTGALLRQGLKFTSTDTEASRYTKTVEFLNRTVGNTAEVNTKGLGSVKLLEAAFRQNREELGARFAPAITSVIEALTRFVTPAKDATGFTTDMKAAFLAVGLAVTGLGVALPILAQAILAVRAATAAFNITLNATKIALAGLGIGLVILAITELALNWEAASGRIKAVVQGLVTFVSGSFASLGKVISGAFHLDTAKIKEGLNEIQNVFKQGVAQATAEIPKQTEKALEKQNQIKKQYANKATQAKREEEAFRQQLQRAEDEAVLLELTNASQEKIDLKSKEIATLKRLTQSRNDEETKLLKAHLAEIIEEQKKYGVAYEAVYKALHTKEVQGAKSASAELVQLAQSKNSTLKTIGKAATIAQIVMSTAESAMKIIAGFSAIPFIGGALGIASAAAIIAYGGERIGEVVAAKDGGLITGGIPGVDSIPALLAPNELVVPSKNYEEVVNSVVQSRTGSPKHAEGPGYAHIEISFAKDAMNYIETKLVQRRNLNLSVQGAV